MKVAIITGASVGIGSSTAQKFLDEGFTVFNLARRQCAVDGVRSLVCDLSSQASIDAACDTLKKAMVGCSEVTLIHNASQMKKDSVDDCSSDNLSQVMATNVIAINSLNQHLLPLMPASSSLLYIGSTLSDKAVPGSFSYVISKHAQLGMMRATCQDLMGSGLHTAMICPGFTDTEMLRTHIGTDPDIEAGVAGMNSFNRLIEPEEIAELICWAHHNPVINGAVLHANLGQKES
ncbi:MAG: SDR family NAD(P)-dependent oxidoreductase [Halioglobus sp.]|nr:SDR family NAD(P)-dependent oxidoreductase [Halioglobus sp.]